MALAVKRDKITLLLDWMYQTYAISEQEQLCEEIECLLKNEIKWMRRKQLKQVYRGWVRENKELPRFRTVEKQVKQVITIF